MQKVHFWLTSVAQKHSCLSSLMSVWEANTRWERTSSEGRRLFGERSVSRARYEVPRRNILYLSCRCSSTVITFIGFPEHKIIFYQVSNTIAWWFTRFYGIKTKAMRSINYKFNCNQQSRSEITPRKIFIGVLKYILYQRLLQYVHSVTLSGIFSEVFL